MEQSTVSANSGVHLFISLPLWIVKLLPELWIRVVIHNQITSQPWASEACKQVHLDFILSISFTWITSNYIQLVTLHKTLPKLSRCKY